MTTTTIHLYYTNGKEEQLVVADWEMHTYGFLELKYTDGTSDYVHANRIKWFRVLPDGTTLANSAKRPID